MAGTIETDGVVISAASERHGACTRSDLLARGVTAGAIDRRVRAGLLLPAGRGLYLVNDLTDQLTPLHVASLAIPEGVISHESAAIVSQFPIDPTLGLKPAHISVPVGTRRRPMGGVIIHRRRLMPKGEDVNIVDGLRKTTSSRTIIDLASRLSPARLRYVVQTQVRDNNPSVTELVACFEATARRGLKGSAALRRMLTSMLGGDLVIRSELETRTLLLLRANGLGDVVPQFRPPWYDGITGVVDFAWPELGIILEADGRRWHQRDQDFVNDRRRDRLAAGHGWITLRVTWEEVTERPGATAADIGAAVNARRGENRIATAS